MSIPRIGIESEVSGDFYQEFKIEHEDGHVTIQIENNTLRTTNYYKKLLEDDKIQLEWKLICDSTFLERYPDDNKKIKIKDTEISGKCEIFYSLSCKIDFSLLPDKSFNPFYNREYFVKKGQIISSERKQIFWANPDDKESHSEFIDIVYDENEPLYVDFTNDVIIISTNDKKLKEDFEGFDQNQNFSLITRQMLLSSIVIAAIRRIGEAQNDDHIDVDKKWAEHLKKSLGIDEDNIEELQLSEYNKALDYYNNFYDGEKLISRAFDKLDKIS